MFTSDYQEILQKAEAVDPVLYGKTRNFLDGHVTYLSPYISRGVITTSFVLKSVIEKGYKFYEIESFVKELLWRDYFQQVWINKGEALHNDLKQSQSNVAHFQIPKAIACAQTGIEAIDKSIKELYDTGYMHNHMRMYTAALACNIAQSHWRHPARWMYYHLLDADWASNACSWQWVAGAFSSKKYFANQENINKYTKTNQSKTFLDCPYETFEKIEIPEPLKDTTMIQLKTSLPNQRNPIIDTNLPTYIYTIYNLDPQWHKNEKGNRILLLEPSHFEQYPISQKVLDFILSLSNNIDNIQLFTSEFHNLEKLQNSKYFIFKEHPTTKHFYGKKEDREFIAAEVSGYFPSFFSYWKKIEPIVKKKFLQNE
jgi:deoxyribodipyrimidine photo-lyase